MSVYSNIYKIRKLIKNSKNPLMFFDCDTDGGTSYLQLKKAFPQIVGFPMNKDYEKHKLLLDKITDKTDLIIIFDIPFLVDEFLVGIGNIKIIWVDHHLENSQDQIKKYKIVHFNPLDLDLNDNRPSSYWAFRVANLKENLFYVTLGSVSDFFLLDVIKKFYDFDKKSFNSLFNITDDKRKELFLFLKKNSFNDKKSKEEREYWIRYLTYESNLIDFKNLFDLMYKLKEEEDVFKALKIISKMDAFELRSNINNGRGLLFQEYSNMIKKYKVLLEKAILENKNNEKLIYFEYSGRASFTRQLSEELCYRFLKHRVVMIVFRKENSDSISLSFRGNNVDVNELVRNSLKGLQGQGGGHKFSAGALIKAKDFDEFKKRVFHEIR